MDFINFMESFSIFRLSKLEKVSTVIALRINPPIWRAYLTGFILNAGMNAMELPVYPLTQAAFAVYGDVIETTGRDFFHINDGKVERYHDLTNVEILGQDRPLVSINRAQPAPLPIVVTQLEKHPLGSQAFVPMQGERFIVIVAAGGETPDISTLKAFITNGLQGVNYHRNVWHHPLFAFETVTNFLTVDRGGADNCDISQLPQGYQLILPAAEGLKS